MPEIQPTNEDPVQIHDGQGFVEKQTVEPGDKYTPAYIVEGGENRVIGIESNTPVAPEFRDADGQKLDASARVVFQKADPEGNPLGNAITFEANLGQFDYPKMRSDEDYFKTTNKGIIIDEREFLHIYVKIPEGTEAFDPANSRLTIGDNVTRTGKPVFIRKKDSLSEEQRMAVDQASTSN